MPMCLLFLIALAQVQSPAASSRSAPAGAEIRGRITDADTGAPIAHIVVVVSRAGVNEPSHYAGTDENGMYRFVGLPAGSYSGMVIPRHREIYAPAGPPPLVVKDGEVRDVNIALKRTYAIPVRVVDDWGEPLAGIEVTARRAISGGRTRFTFRHATDDLGRMRVFGLERGSYAVCAQVDPSRSATGRPTRANREALLPTCYPSTNEQEATVVQIDRSDAEEIEIRMRRGRTYTVAGHIVDASGAPAPHAFLSLTTYIPGGSSSRGVGVDSEGRFAITSVLPADYGIEATLGGPTRPEQRRPLEAGFVPLSVNADISDLVVQLKLGVDVPGTVELEDPSAPFPRPGGSGLMIATRLAYDRIAGQGSHQSAIARADRTFTLEDTFGRRELDVVNVPNGWYLKSIEYDGKEVIDSAVEFKSAKTPLPLKVLLSNRGAVLTGRVVDESGRPVARAQVLAFREQSSSRNRSAVSAASGSFRLGPLREGTYILVALPAGSEAIQLGQWDRIARLKSSGERVTLGELEERTVEVRLIVEK